MTKIGRPTDYKEEYKKIVLDLLDQGKSMVQIARALRVSRSTLYLWAEKHKEFSDTISLGKDWSQGWWEDLGQENMHNRDFNFNMWHANMKARFKEDWLVQTNSVAKIEFNGFIKEIKDLEEEYKKKNKKEY